MGLKIKELFLKKTKKKKKRKTDGLGQEWYWVTNVLG
jgi:hypothetical protein